MQTCLSRFIADILAAPNKMQLRRDSTITSTLHLRAPRATYPPTNIARWVNDVHISAFHRTEAKGRVPYMIELQPLDRHLEDVPLVTGEGKHLADLVDNEVLHWSFARSPIAHGVVTGP